MAITLSLELGVKSDPVEYRYSYEWLFDIMAEEGATALQLGTFFELYHLPNEFFLELAATAASRGVRVASVFTSHRELGGFFRAESGWESVARRNFERLIEVGALLGASSVGSSPGSVPRDRMSTKAAGVAAYLRHMKELSHYAFERGLKWLTVEPMSCLAEPPTLPGEIAAMMDELQGYHEAHSGATAGFGLCGDVSHGYADRDGNVAHMHMDLLEACLPWLTELHLKNTDAVYNGTFGFGSAERERGVVDVSKVRKFLLERRAELPVSGLVGYLEVGGPKLGRDYSDPLLERQLRESLRYLSRAFPATAEDPDPTPAYG